MPNEFANLSNEAKLLFVMFGIGNGYADFDEWSQITGKSYEEWKDTWCELMILIEIWQETARKARQQRTHR